MICLFSFLRCVAFIADVLLDWRLWLTDAGSVVTHKRLDPNPAAQTPRVAHPAPVQAAPPPANERQDRNRRAAALERNQRAAYDDDAEEYEEDHVRVF